MREKLTKRAQLARGHQSVEILREIERREREKPCGEQYNIILD